MNLLEFHTVTGLSTLVLLMLTLYIHKIQMVENNRWHHYLAYATLGFISLTIVNGIIMVLESQMFMRF